MSDIKIILRANEYIAVFKSLMLISIDINTSSLETKAKHVLLQKLYLRMSKNMFKLNKKNNLTLSIPEAWAFYNKIQEIFPLVGNYEIVVLQSIINTIHQKTI